jgi:non-homologous end joining protein Ku
LASRPTWSGALHINAFLEAHVSFTKGTEDYRGREGLVELCACHKKPFKRSSVCVEGFTRLTQEMEKEGQTDNTTAAIKGVPNGEDTWVALGDDTIAAIEAAGTKDTITIAAILDPEQIPLERTHGMFYVTPNKKVKGSEKAVGLLYRTLARAGTMAVAKWAPRGREMLIVIRPNEREETLIASPLLFGAEVRDFVPYKLAGGDVSQEEIDLATQLLDRLPREFDFAVACDEAVAVRQEAIDAARNGKDIPVKAPTPAADAAPDMMAALRAALDATPGGDEQAAVLAASN